MTVKQIPEGYQPITPYFVVAKASEFLAFLKSAFGAEIVGVSERDGVIYNAEVRVGTSMLMVADGRGKAPAGRSMMYLYVPNVDAVYAQALKAGAKAVMPPTDQIYGDRSGGVEDASGNQWWIATHIRDVTPDEIAKAMAAQGR